MLVCDLFRQTQTPPSRRRKSGLFTATTSVQCSGRQGNHLWSESNGAATTEQRPTVLRLKILAPNLPLIRFIANLLARAENSLFLISAPIAHSFSLSHNESGKYFHKGLWQQSHIQHARILYHMLFRALNTTLITIFTELSVQCPTSSLKNSPRCKNICFNII